MTLAPCPSVVIEARLVTRIPVRAGAHRVGVAMTRGRWYFEGTFVERLPIASDAYIYGWSSGPGNGKIDLAIDTVEITGPFSVPATPPDSASRQRIFVCRPTSRSARQEEACASRILSTLATRAYRRPIVESSGDVQTLLEFYRAGRQSSGFDSGIRRAVARVLVDPQFLFRRRIPDLPLQFLVSEPRDYFQFVGVQTFTSSDDFD